MSLSPGTRLGVYQVTAPIGEGGMGQVYRATDTKLKRDVAIKILPPSVAADADRLARFQREAEVLASLNHPNIAAIYGLEESAGMTALIMELVEGEDLSAHIARAPLPLADTLSIARQIAEAVEAAHEQGIIHRDLKPGNIKVRADGTVKVLDFGLAKSAAPAGASNSSASALANSPTMTSPAMTAMGMILGTAAYMAPEQAKGRAVDKRADIWAFGCVLHEMVTGRRLFDAEDVSETLAAVLTRDVSVTAIPADLPPRLRMLLRDCLVRDPRQRLRDMGDARRVIDEIITGPPDEAGAAAVIPRAALPTWRRVLPWAVAGTLGVALVSALLLWAPWNTTASPTPRRLLASIGVDAALVTDRGAAAVLSPDGTTLVFSARQEAQPRLFIRKLDELQATPLAGTEGAVYPFFSPDGQWIAFFTGTRLKKVSVAGGAPADLCAAAAGRGGAWIDQDTIVFSPAGGVDSALLRVPAGGGTPTPFGTFNQGATTQRWPQPLPGGKHVLYTESASIGNFDGANVVVATVPTDAAAKAGPAKVVVPSAYYGRYVPSGLEGGLGRRSLGGSGHLLYIQQGALFAVPFDPVRLETLGPRVPVIQGVMSSATSGGAQVDVSREGTVAYVPGGVSSNLANTMDLMTRDGQTSGLRAARSQWANPRFSPDGQKIAMDVSDGRQRDIWVYDSVRDTLTQLTFDAASDTNPIWTPDGKRIAFTSNRGEAGRTRNLYWVSADGAGEVTRLTHSPGEQYPSAWHPSGRFLGFAEQRGATGWDAMILPMEGDAARGWTPGTPTVFRGTTAHEDGPTFSPDGQFAAYYGNEGGGTGFDIYVRPFPGAGGPWRVSTNPGSMYPRWSATTHELFWADPAQFRVMFMRFSVAGDAFVPGKPEIWSPKSFLWVNDGNSYYDIHPDGKHVAVASAAGQTVQDHVVIMTSFFDYLRTVAPAKQ